MFLEDQEVKNNLLNMAQQTIALLLGMIGLIGYFVTEKHFKK
jgi:uncharacterized protein YneF (UPF0154 family)